ncbi:hypothetical protein TNCV_1967871 [Trichonephila clavipes]|nr:hypothetical protein TNCV_1967871 [Trichonephila clavipes]
MGTKAYCAPLSIRDHWALRCMSRCPDQVINLKRKTPVFSPQASLVLICRPTEVSRLGGVVGLALYAQVCGVYLVLSQRICMMQKFDSVHVCSGYQGLLDRQFLALCPAPFCPSTKSSLTRGNFAQEKERPDRYQPD